MNYDTVLPDKILRRYRRPQTTPTKEWLKFGAFVLALYAAIGALICALPDSRSQRLEKARSKAMIDAAMAKTFTPVEPKAPRAQLVKSTTTVCTP